MKLTISRSVEHKGIFTKTTVLYLNVDLEVSSREIAMLEWDNITWKYDCIPGEGIVSHMGAVTLGEIAGKRTRWGFSDARHLENFEKDMIEAAKKLKRKLENIAIRQQELIEIERRRKQGVADFRPEGPRKIEL